MSSLYSCVNCKINFEQEAQYKLHYKSEHHRYNVKRRLIGLNPLSYQQYVVQFQNEISSKSSTQNELHCELCCKKFLSPQTYKQHLNSQKHKNNRKKIAQLSNKTSQADEKSQTSSCSQFSVIGDAKKKYLQCLFCSHAYSKQHMKSVHNFPPFSDECTDVNELVVFVRGEIQTGNCLLCHQKFTCEESAKQHMLDSGHAQLDLHNFSRYERFYLWKIIEEQTDFDQFNEDNEEFEELKKETLESLEKKRLERIQPTNIGFLINGKEVGTRAYKQYYKQHLLRQIPINEFRQQKALQNDGDWKSSLMNKQMLPCRYDKSQNPTVTHR